MRKSFGADKVAIFADIHVKHAELLSKMSITASAKKAFAKGADAVIMTCGWTGVEPDTAKMTKVRKAVGNMPILVGSGADKDNVGKLLGVANGVIVSTSLKQGIPKSAERNVMGYEQRISQKKFQILFMLLGRVSFEYLFGKLSV